MIVTDVIGTHNWLRYQRIKPQEGIAKKAYWVVSESQNGNRKVNWTRTRFLVRFDDECYWSPWGEGWLTAANFRTLKEARAAVMTVTLLSS